VPDRLERALEEAESAATTAGADVFELCATEELSLSIEASDGAVRAEERCVERVIGIRVLDGGIGFAATTDLCRSALIAAAHRARDEARLVRPARIRGFAAPERRTQRRGPPFLDARTTAEPREELRTLARELEAGIQSQRVLGARPVGIHEVRARFFLRTSGGHAAFEESSRAAISVHALAKKGDDAQVGSAAASGLALADLDGPAIAARAARAAEARLGALPVPTGRCSVVFAPEVVAELLEALVPALLGDALDRGTSFLGRQLGAPVLGPRITLEDVPHDPALDGAAWIDGEGLPTSARVLVRDGAWVGVLDDLESAARGGRRPGAEALRTGASARPRAGAHALSLRPGRVGRSALLDGAALYVTEVSGAHTIQPDTGAFSLGLVGFRVERSGVLGVGVEGATIGGSLSSVFGPGAQLGDWTEIHGGIRAPALRVDGIEVAGSGSDPFLESIH